MPFNGSGVYSAPSLPASWNPAQSGGTADPTDWNTLLADIVAGLSTVVCRDGQSTITANIPMATHKFTGLAAGTGNGDSVRYEQIVPGLRSLLVGLGMSNNGASPNTKIDVAAGACMDSTQAQLFSVSAGTIDCGTVGANGLDAGSLANTTWYHAYAIGKTDGTTALLASTSASAPTLPTGYTLKRRIGSFRTDGSAHIRVFTQYGDLFEWASPITDILATNPGTSAVTATLSVPSGVNMQAWVSGYIQNQSNSNVVLYFSDLATTDSAPGAGSVQSLIGQAASAMSVASGDFYVMTNTSSQIRYRLSASGASDVVGILTKGWIDTRGRNS